MCWNPTIEVRTALRISVLIVAAGAVAWCCQLPRPNLAATPLAAITAAAQRTSASLPAETATPPATQTPPSRSLVGAVGLGWG
jgi:hypothetical protein